MGSEVLPLRRIDHLRFFVGNARQSAYFYRNAFGFDVIAYAGLETETRHEAGYVLRQGEITFVLASPLSPNHPENQRLTLHGDGVQDIALEVDDVDAAYAGSGAPRRRRRRRSRRFWKTSTASTNTPRSAPMATRHTPSSTATATAASSPRVTSRSIPDRYSPRTFQPVGLKVIDHIVANVEEGKMDDWVDFYENVMGFSLLVHFDDKDISTEYSALMSKVVQDGGGRIKFPDQRAGQEPATVADRRVPELSTAGRACSTSRWPPTTSLKPCVPCATTTCRSSGAPGLLRDAAASASAPIEEDLRELAELGILVDRDDEGLSAADLHQAGRGPADAVLRDHPAARLAELRQGQLQGPLRGHRARTGAARDALSSA